LSLGTSYQRAINLAKSTYYLLVELLLLEGLTVLYLKFWIGMINEEHSRSNLKQCHLGLFVFNVS
jgi:hypothetical protein